uniref:CSON015038 protein n=1 Tax=Culicoides sonorensis TaxID=179676 RepID=A0A336LNA4_CULSO
MEISLNSTESLTFFHNNHSITLNSTEYQNKSTYENEFYYYFDEIDFELPEKQNQTMKCLRKCCENNEIYNTIEKVCHVNENINEMLKKFHYKYGEISMRSENIVDLCDSDEIIVEFDSISMENVTFNDDSIEIMEFNTENFCVDLSELSVNSSNLPLMVRGCFPQSICDAIPCTRKCCKGGEKLKYENESSSCVPFNGHVSPTFHYIENWNLENEITRPHDLRVFGVIQGQKCAKFQLDPDEYLLNHADGHLHINGTSIIFTNDKYCLEIVDYDGMYVLEMFVCVEPDPEPMDRLQNIIGFILSILGFLLTLLIYIFILKVRNLHSKIIICYCITFLIAYLALLRAQFEVAFSDFCKPFAYLIYFSFISGFVWLQIMCFDIWLKFSSTRNRESTKSKRFHFYVMYSIFLPALLSSMVAVFQHTDILPLKFRPYLGEDYCWFQGLDRHDTVPTPTMSTTASNKHRIVVVKKTT